MEFGLDFAAIAVALGAGIRYLHTSYKDRNAVRLALIAEITALADLIEIREYVKGLLEAATAVEASGEGLTFTVVVPEGYNIVYRTHVTKLGTLRGHETMDVVRFYQLVDSAISDVSKEGALGIGSDNPEAFREAAEVLNQATALARSLNVKSSWKSRVW